MNPISSYALKTIRRCVYFPLSNRGGLVRCEALFLCEGVRGIHTRNPSSRWSSTRRCKREESPKKYADTDSASTDPLMLGQTFFNSRSALWMSVLVAVGSFVWEFTRTKAIQLMEWIRDLVFVQIEVRSHQPEFAMLLDWVASHPRTRELRSLSVLSGASEFTECESTNFSFDSLTSTETDATRELVGDVGKEEVARPCVQFTLGYGTYLLNAPWYRWTCARKGMNGPFLWVTRAIDQDRKHTLSYEPNEVLTFTMLVHRRCELLELVQRAKAAYVEKSMRRTSIFFPSSVGNSWVQLAERTKRPMESVVLPSGIAEELLQECQKFFRARLWYANKGIPWRRGYLLYGPPGTGKSSLIFSLAGQLNSSVYILNLNQKGMDDSRLYYLMKNVPEHSLVLLEDLDAVMSNKSDGSSCFQAESVTLSGLLNSMDGIAASEGRVLFVTSNYPEKIPPALLRSGRVDRRIAFASMNPEQIRSMFLRYHGCSRIVQEQNDKTHICGYLSEVADTLASWIPPDSITPAQFQNFLLAIPPHPFASDHNSNSDCTVLAGEYTNRLQTLLKKDWFNVWQQESKHPCTSQI